MAVRREESCSGGVGLCSSVAESKQVLCVCVPALENHLAWGHLCQARCRAEGTV